MLAQDGGAHPAPHSAPTSHTHAVISSEQRHNLHGKDFQQIYEAARTKESYSAK